MELRVTVNADQRYYLDEGLVQHADSLLHDLSLFGSMKADLYEQLYKKTFLSDGPLMNETYASYLKDRYHTNDYVNAAVYTKASGVISSQKELRKLYRQTAAEDIKVRNAKIEDTEARLQKALAVKTSIVDYLKTGKWVRPYKGCRIKVRGGSILPYNSGAVPIQEYESSLDQKIAGLRTRVKQLRYGLSRQEQKKRNLDTLPPKRIIFGTKKRYREKDATEDMDAWKAAFHEARGSGFSYPGRHDSKHCNFMVYRKQGDLHIRCTDGKEAVFRLFALTRYFDEYEALLAAAPAERKAICYNITLKTDRDGRKYFLVSVTLPLENNHANHGFADGCVSVDMNWDHLAVSDIGRDGKLLESLSIPFCIEGKTSGQVKNIIGRAVKQLGDYCTEKKKPLVMEDVDTTVSKSGMRYGHKKRNRHASLLASRQITACIMNQGYRQSFEVYRIHPAYTSFIGKVKFMRKMGKPVHAAASYVIGLYGMGRDDLLALPKELSCLVPDDPDRPITLWQAWRKVYGAFSGIPAHAFYRSLPALGTLKKPTLSCMAEAIKKQAGLADLSVL